MKTIAFAVAGIGLLATGASASAPGEWAALNQRVNRACIAMSGLPRPQVLNTTISFSDVIGTEVRMIRGTDKRGRIKRLLCAYNRSTGRTEVQEASGWFAASVRP